MVEKALVKAVQESLRKHPAPGSSSSSEYASSDFKFHSIARLWAGMGYIYRVDIDAKGSTTGPHSRVVKHVRLPSTIDSRGDQRKADSYFVEANFYEHLVPLLRSGDNGNSIINLPESYHVERTEKSISIVMSYIDANGSAYLNADRTRLVLSWLARFHGATWGQRAPQLVQQHGLQRLVTYWHLETRPDEHASMSNKGWEGRSRMPRVVRWLDKSAADIVRTDDA